MLATSGGGEDSFVESMVNRASPGGSDKLTDLRPGPAGVSAPIAACQKFRKAVT
jgi:hypothetical protein